MWWKWVFFCLYYLRNCHIAISISNTFKLLFYLHTFCWAPGPLVHVRSHWIVVFHLCCIPFIMEVGPRNDITAHSCVPESENKMTTSTKAILALALPEYKQLQDKCGPSAAFKHGGQRGNTDYSLFFLSEYFIVSKVSKGECSVYCLLSGQPSFKANSGASEEPPTLWVGNPTSGTFQLKLLTINGNNCYFQ